jgi:dihydrofolate reductase
MRELIVSNLVSLDGYFEGPNQELDWFIVEEEFLEYASETLRSIDAILYGRITYEHMAAYWPHAMDNDAFITHKMNSLQKIVFSKTLDQAEWNNTTVVKGDIAEEVKKLKQQPGKDLVIFGSGQLVSFLAEKGLIDEYRIIVNPVILGKGNPLFKVKDKISLNLVDTKELSSGVIILYYEPVREQ